MGTTILIIDDDMGDIKNFKDHVTEWHSKYKVEFETEFYKAKEKIKEIRGSGDKLAAVFIDICEKKANYRPMGLDTIATIREEFDEVLIVAYTQYEKYHAEALEKGADWVWKKQDLKELELGAIEDRIKKHNTDHKKADKILAKIDIVTQVLQNFSNSVLKITRDRRKGHAVFELKDEYDVQDLIYTMLKPLFTDLVEEDPSPKVGGRGSRIDIVIPTRKVVIETKMIKETDDNENQYIDDLKKDIESYHKHPDLEYLICFVYDPYRKGKDDSNFYDLAGERMVRGKQFSEITIVQH